MKIAIYTAITGDKTKLVDPPIVHPNVDYIAYVDKISKECKVWDQRSALAFSLDKVYYHRRNAKIYKILPNFYLNEYDLTVWVDGNIFCKMDPNDIYNKFLLPNQSNLGVFRHKRTKCIYDESTTIKHKDHEFLIEEQMAYYKKENFPTNTHGYHLSFIVRKKSIENDLINLRWWEQICKFSSRDQLSFPFVLWSLNINPTIFPGFISIHRPPDLINGRSPDDIVLTVSKR